MRVYLVLCGGYIGGWAGVGMGWGGVRFEGRVGMGWAGIRSGG